MKKRFFIPILTISTCLILLFSHCKRDIKSKFPKFKQKSWIKDKDACLNKRVKQIDALTNNSQVFIGLDETTITNFLGPFNEKHVHERGELELVYFVDPGKQCKDKSKVKSRFQRIFVIEFGPLDLVESASLQLR